MGTMVFDGFGLLEDTLLRLLHLLLYMLRALLAVLPRNLMLPFFDASGIRQRGLYFCMFARISRVCFSALDYFCGTGGTTRTALKSGMR